MFWRTTQHRLETGVLSSAVSVICGVTAARAP
jgi:hypothetical protein